MFTIFDITLCFAFIRVSSTYNIMTLIKKFAMLFNQMIVDAIETPIRIYMPLAL